MTPTTEMDRDLLVNLLRRYSPSGYEEEATAYLVSWLQEQGLKASLDLAGNACASWGRGERTLCLLGHIDTVAGRLPVTARDGTVTGRGAVDAKGPLVAFASALARVARDNEEPEGVRILLVGAVGEESDSRGARHLLKGPGVPSATIIGEPSRWDRVTLGYRGSLRGVYQVRAPRAHTAAEVATAAEEALRVWSRVARDADQYNRPEEGKGASPFHSLSPRLLAVSSWDDGAEGRARIRFSVRIPPGLGVDEVKRRLRDLTLPHRLQFDGAEEPFTAERNTPLVRDLLRAMRASGARPRFSMKTGTSDMNVVGPVWKGPIAAYGPGDPTLSHTQDERISLEELSRSVAVLEKLLGSWVRGTPPG